MQEIQDHLVHFPEGFYDMNRYPERIEQGGKRLVTKLQYQQMRNSDGSVELVRIQPPVDVLQRLVVKAREEKVRAMLDDELSVLPEAKPFTTLNLEEQEVTAEGNLEDIVATVDDEPDWQPIGW